MIRRILFIIMLVCGMGLLWLPFLDMLQHRDYYRVKADGTWQEPPNGNVCNSHAANVTGTFENTNCVVYFMGLPLVFIGAGIWFGVLDRKFPGESGK